MSIDPKMVEELRAKFGPEVSLLDVADELVGIKAPSRVAYSQYRDFMLDDAKKSRANETLVFNAVVWPTSRGEIEALFDRKPAIIDTIALEAVRLAGGGVQAKKL